MQDDESHGLPRIAKYKPYYDELKKGKTYLWCSCGLSNKQPLCDGSHKGTSFLPVRYVAQEEGQEVLFCGCKHSDNTPFCDGAHNNLKGGVTYSDPTSDVNAAIRSVERDAQGVAMLDGGCYVHGVNKLSMERRGNIAYAQLVGKENGAQHQSLYHLEAVSGTASARTNLLFRNSEIVLLVTSGNGAITISGSTFCIAEHDGVYVRTGEVFSLEALSEEPLTAYVCVCPQTDQLAFPKSMPSNMDQKFPIRVIATNVEHNQVVGDRFFQLLVNKAIGSTMMTQFIGRIPPSMADFHRHLYEETLVVLEGSGCMWTSNFKTHVSQGDVIFLPRKQLHSLQCTSDSGMTLAGFIYPGDNPSINY